MQHCIYFCSAVLRSSRRQLLRPALRRTLSLKAELRFAEFEKLSVRVSDAEWAPRGPLAAVSTVQQSGGGR